MRISTADPWFLGTYGLTRPVTREGEEAGVGHDRQLPGRPHWSGWKRAWRYGSSSCKLVPRAPVCASLGYPRATRGRVLRKHPSHRSQESSRSPSAAATPHALGSRRHPLKFPRPQKQPQDRNLAQVPCLRGDSRKPGARAREGNGPAERPGHHGS